MEPPKRVTRDADEAAPSENIPQQLIITTVDNVYGGHVYGGLGLSTSSDVSRCTIVAQRRTGVAAPLRFERSCVSLRS